MFQEGVLCAIILERKRRVSLSGLSCAWILTFPKRMSFSWQKIADEFNLKKQADELGVKVWQSPSFLFILMGFIIIMAMTGVYFAARNYDSPEIFIISEFLIVIVLFTVGNVLIRGVEQIAHANKMKTEFVSIASHQLKTPLAAVNWEIELLVSKYFEGLNAKQREIIDEIGRANAKMGRLVNDLLDVARIDQGRLALGKEAVDMAVVVREVLESNRILAKAHGVKLVLDAQEGLPAVSGDKQHLVVVLDNLVSNAIKYIGKGSKVEALVRERDGFVEVSIKDDGVGIPKIQQGKLFQKFFRSDNAVRNQTEGTGLGLYIAKNIIKQSGGKMWFFSEEGKGSVFSFNLPARTK